MCVCTGIVWLLLGGPVKCVQAFRLRQMMNDWLVLKKNTQRKSWEDKRCTITIGSTWPVLQGTTLMSMASIGSHANTIHMLSVNCTQKQSSACRQCLGPKLFQPISNRGRWCSCTGRAAGTRMNSDLCHILASEGMEQCHGGDEMDFSQIQQYAWRHQAAVERSILEYCKCYM